MPTMRTTAPPTRIDHDAFAVIPARIPRAQ